MPIVNLLPPSLSNLLPNYLWLIYYYVLRVSLKTSVLTVCALQLKSPLVPRKPVKPDNKKHSDEDDSCSVASGYTLIILIVEGCQNLISCFSYSINDFLWLYLIIFYDHVKNCNFSEVVQVQGNCCFCSKLSVNWTRTKKKGGKVCWLISFVSTGFSSQIDRCIPFYLCYSFIQN